ncbi:RNA methyltransferase [Luteolibacter pohnpeiensis]|uniref:RNA methyltransferase n=1 Tax=Luteolibacter pohnpeiensis TaxID=454153 RepID=A0A934SBF1_9BACT|nr:RNA methyltransferase [Luteolibacter pohnpeiensis]MBK1882213.1 RNA methyltransferase [Luteolibacter pohnpeiensis]
MRMHRLLAEAAAEIAKSVFREHRVLDHELAAAFDANPRWGKRDRSFIAETVFEVVRWRRVLGFLVDSEETTALCAAQWVRMGYDLPDWWNYNGASVDEIRSREAEIAGQPRAIRESIPDWLDELGVVELGDAWDAEIAALNQRAPVYLRVNTLCATRDQAISWLAENHVTASEVPGLPDALVLPAGKVLPKPLRLDGRIEIQDAGSQMISPLVDPQPGERIIDACSGAGGKSLHLAALMQNEGRVFGMDVDQKKLSELERRAKRARASCLKTKLIVETMAEDFAGVADRLLIDSPCSGLGTLKRQPDLKWRLKPAQLDRVRAIQQELLENYTAMLKPGGRLVYATCSILPSENRQQVDRLIASGGFSLIKEKPVSPHQTGFDGFYAAALLKNG